MAKKPARIDRRINVILLESNKHLWEKYEVVKVKPIFAKNVLFPQWLAILADKDSLYWYKARMENAQQEKTKKSDVYSDVFSKIKNNDGLVFSMKTNEKGALYEKIDPTHITAMIKTTYNVDVAEHLFNMKKKITQVGEYTIPFEYNGLEKDLHIVVKGEHATEEQTVEAVS